MKIRSKLKNLQLRLANRINIEKLHKALHTKLKDFNESAIGKFNRHKFCFAYYDGKKLIAGLYAYLTLGNFYIDLLWVDENYRSLSLGANLLKLAEEHANKNAALYVRVNTGSFQAPKFYLKHGYTQLAKLPLKMPHKNKAYDYYFIKYLKNKR